LHDRNGLVLGLSTNYMLTLSATKIEMLACEDQTVTDLRKDTIEKIKRLEAAKKIADRTWAPKEEFAG
jgi:hypothetical protein